MYTQTNILNHQNGTLSTPAQYDDTVLKDFYRNRLVLITGGAGFIGSHLAELLVELGARVSVLDNLSTGKQENLAAIAHQIQFIHGDITDAATCIAATKHTEIIFHLAALVSVPESVKHPSKCQQINIDGTFNLLEAARINGVPRFVFSSSSAVYGAVDGACTEEMAPSPLSPYGYAKWMGELYCQQYARVFGIHTVCLRYFNVCGPRQDPNGAYAGVVAAFSKQMAANKPLTVLGDGLQTRDFIPVHEVARANARLAALPAATMQGDAYNIGSGKSITLLELIEKLKTEQFPTYCQPVTFAPARSGDIRHSRAHCAKYRQVLGQ